MSLRLYQNPEESIDLSGLDFALDNNEARICNDCNRPFFQYRNGSVASVCPTCADIAQKRPTIAIERSRLARFDGVRIDSLPSWNWRRFQAGPHDEKRWRIDFSGKSMLPDEPTGNGKWSGRIVIWSTRIRNPGDIVCVRHMRAIHRVAAVYDGNGQRSTIPLSAAKDFDAEIEEEKHEYIVLERTDARVRYVLKWSEAPEPNLWSMQCTTESLCARLCIRGES